MNYKKCEKAIQSILSVVTINNDSKTIVTNAPKFYTFRDKELTIKNLDDLLIYNENLDILFKELKSSERIFSYDYLDDVLCNAILNESENIFNEVHDVINDLENKEYIFLVPVYGLKVIDESKKELGKFKFIKHNNIDNYIENDLSVQLKRSNHFDSIPTTDLCFVEIRCICAEIKMAEEKLHEISIQLENTLRFMHGDNDKNCGIGITNYNVKMGEHYFSLCSDGTVTNLSNSGFMTPPVPIYLDQWFENKLNIKIWDILSKSENTDIEKRLVSAINWIGMAINEKNESLAFVQCMFAIESFSQVEKGFITKSITAQISEDLAFIIGSDLENRKKIEKLFKNLYGIRSKIAHGTKEDNLYVNLQNAIALSKDLVACMLLRDEFNQLKDMNELRNKILEMRYSV